MAVTEFQKKICRLIADSRKQQGASYIAGGVSLNTLASGTRISHDIDIFNDTLDALHYGWDNDRKLLAGNGYNISVVRERESFVEAVVSKDDNSVVLQWTRDSAFRFFPLVEHVDFGLTLHPVDLATNKCLALVGRLEVRDWIDMITCHKNIQHLGLLAWAACGKDPGFSPAFIVAQAGRTAHYSEVELDMLVFDGDPPEFKDLNSTWKNALDEAGKLVQLLDAREAGKCLLRQTGELLNGTFPEIKDNLKTGNLHFHSGSICGAFPHIVRHNGSIRR